MYCVYCAHLSVPYVGTYSTHIHTHHSTTHSLAVPLHYITDSHVGMTLRALLLPLQVVDRPLLLHHCAVDPARHSRRPVLWAGRQQETQTTLRKDPTVKLWWSEPACVSQPHCNIRRMGLHALYPTSSNTYVCTVCTYVTYMYIHSNTCTYACTYVQLTHSPTLHVQ